MSAPAEVDRPSSRTAARADAAVSAVAERLRDVDVVRVTVTVPGNVEPVFGMAPWNPVSVSHGYPGTALLYAALHRVRPDEGWDAVGHRHLEAATAALAGWSGPPSLFTGVGAVAFAARAASEQGTRYTRLLETLDGWMREQCREAVGRERRRLEARRGTTWMAYDSVVGLAGTGRYLLARAGDADGSPAEARELTAEVLAYLVDLTRPISIDGSTVPGWYVPVEEQPVEQDRIAYPHGDFNAGLAHGICGPLALLAVAAHQGVTVPGQDEAMGRIVDWLLRWKRKDGHGAYWPARVSWAEEVTGEPTGTLFSRAAWCYGTPGVARALWLAGRALGDQSVQAEALTGLAAVYRRPRAEWRIDGPTFCHGLSGLAQITRRMASDSGLTWLDDCANQVCDDVAGYFHPAHPFGFQHFVPVEPTGWTPETGWRGIDVAGVLEGAAGPALTLLPLVVDDPTPWDALFLLA